ncbi:trichohyalin isoform X3 [Episyrphus balteatus]|uniref:trichohyalin isoform X3 n=1 Tax=Episyrphus balteatus TaxID=286459 RepID=UPI002485732B|nr:trichohyalin isoform X3 [Episyrphus balteatus]
MLPEVGELVFSFVVGYMGALEFLYVVRHLYHWGFRHNPEMRDYKSEAESLRKLQEQLKNAIAEAKEREAMGLQAMKDGVMYKDGFRIDEDRKKIEELKEKVKIQEKIAERQREIEAELERQRKIEEETKQQLKKAEEELRRMEEEKKREKQKAEEEKRKAEEAKRKAEEEEKRKAEEAKKKAADEKRKAEEEENMKKILEAEKKKEEEQRRHEEEKENQRKIVQAEKEREEKQRQLEIEAEKKKQEEERKENERKILQAEKEREEKQRQLEIEAENERKLLQAEKDREEKQRQQEIEDEKVVQKLLAEEREREKAEKERTLKLLEAERQQQEIERQQQAENEERENTARLIAAEQEAIAKQREQEEHEEQVRNLLKAERELELKKQEMEEEAANLQRLIEAEKQMEERQRKIDEDALEKLKTAQEEMELRQSFDPNAEAEEAAFIKKEIGQTDQSIPQTVKTQYGQTISESLKPKTLLFPGVSEESSSAEPVSSLQSSFSTQQSSEAVLPDLHFDEYERQAPDGGEDMPSLQYSDDYLRSLDGIKNKPLVREDGSGRRRAFKKRRSSGSSTSSRESRASREEELKMFTSLEEEEFENIRKGDSEYETIKYASEPNLKVGKQRRHKRSPAKDAKRDPNDKGSLEQLDEEDSNPWGEVKPENYKNTDFWKREKNLSIDEEKEEFDAKQRIQSPSTAAVNIPKMSSFEEATKSQHEEALSALKRQKSKDPEPIQEPDDEESETKNVSKVADARLSPAGSNSSPASASASISPALQSPDTKRANSLETEDKTTSGTTSPTTGLRRSPRVDEMRQYEEKWKSEDRKARHEAGKNPNIEIEYASDEEPMSPEHLPEGISDFYDFNASINPSRSRSRSRSKTPALNRSTRKN